MRAVENSPGTNSPEWDQALGGARGPFPPGGTGGFPGWLTEGGRRLASAVGRVRDQKPGRNARAVSELAQQVVVPGVALLAVFPLDVNGIAYPSGLQHRIRHRKKGENGELEQSEGDDAKSARIPRASGYVASMISCHALYFEGTGQLLQWRQAVKDQQSR